MATTSIWSVKGWLGKVVLYAENPEKTENPKVHETTYQTPSQLQGLSDVITYASRKTEQGELMRRFVTGINCQPETARDEMMATKKHYGKTEGVIAYHGYQSFAPGEATPEMAHEIGVKLAERLWGERFQVVVATHLDKAHHLHTHFVVNNVSMTDGKKYYRSEQDYRDMQRESDALCREYGLSVIDHPKRGQSKHYSEWKAEQDGQQTWRGIVKKDIDAAIRRSLTERQFWEALRKMGYEVKRGKDISVRPPGKERFVRLQRNFDYTIESIRRRILAQNRQEAVSQPPPRKPMRFRRTFHTLHRITGLRALYFHYLTRMGVLPKKRTPNPNRVYFLFREDIRFVQRIAREARLLVRYNIDTAEQLNEYKASLTSQIQTLCNQRKSRDGVDELSKRISQLRREVKLCGDIETRSCVMREKFHRSIEDQNQMKKEVTTHEPFRRRR